MNLLFCKDPADFRDTFLDETFPVQKSSANLYGLTFVEGAVDFYTLISINQNLGYYCNFFNNNCFAAGGHLAHFKSTTFERHHGRLAGHVGFTGIGAA